MIQFVKHTLKINYEEKEYYFSNVKTFYELIECIFKNLKTNSDSVMKKIKIKIK